MRLVRQHWEHLDDESKRLIPRFLRPDDGHLKGEGERRQRYVERHCNEYIDTPHCRLHYSTEPGHVEIPGAAQDVDTDGQFAFVAAREGGLQVVELSRPGEPVIAGALDMPGSAVAIEVVALYAYVATDSAGLQVVDVSTPEAPRGIAAVEVPGVVRAGPNPFFDTTTWVLRIADASSDVRLNVYDALGRRVRQLVNRQLARGDHPITWDRTTDASRRAVSSVYYYELRVDRQVQSGRLVVLN